MTDTHAVLDWVTSTAGTITAISAAIAAVGTVTHAYVVRPTARWFKKIDKAIGELLPNGGESLRDGVNRLEDSLAEFTARTRVVEDADRKAIYECDVGGACVSATTALCELYGLSLEQMKGQGWLAAVIDADRERVFTHWKQSVASNIPYSDSYTIRNQRTGEMIPLETIAKSIIGRDGNVRRYVGFVERAKVGVGVGAGG